MKKKKRKSSMRQLRLIKENFEKPDSNPISLMNLREGIPPDRTTPAGSYAPSAR